MLSTEAQVTLTVNAINDPPDTVADTAAVDEDNSVTIDVLANDSDRDGNLLPATVTVSTPPSNGTTSVDRETGAISYTPNENYFGDDSFEYTVTDDGTPLPGLSAAATVSITVNPVNDAPVATDDTTVTNEDNAVTFDVVANDTDVDGTPQRNTVEIITPPENGGARVDPASSAITSRQTPTTTAPIPSCIASATTANPTPCSPIPPR